MPRPAHSGVDSITIVAHPDLIRALSAAASERGMTRSALLRKVAADFLRDAGHLAAEAPITHHEARWARTH